MDIITAPESMQNQAAAMRRKGQCLGLVPTMGYLHAGHLSLVALARRHADVVIVSIFVNPTQFGPNEDLARYPRDFERDQNLCQSAGVDTIFYPSANAIYTPDHTVYVEETALSKGLCGASRPGHFRGVLTVVAKLFNLCLPDMAVFGQKDAQQARLIQQMTRDLNFPVRIELGPIIREPDGLAMSSRNTYLSPEHRRDALCLSNALKLARRLYREGERQADRIKDKMRIAIQAVKSANIDYIEIVDHQTLAPVGTLEKPSLIALAVWIGKTRLIDNLPLPDDRLGNLPE